jgi:hypothetical protein
MVNRSVELRHALFDTLKQLHVEAADRFPHPYLDPGFGALGLIFHKKVGDGRYDFCTPENCYPFAGTGGEGVHFSFLRLGGLIDEASPVVVTIPASGGRNFVVGESLRDFLCLGCKRGWFALEQLMYHPELTMRVYTDPGWQATESWHASAGYEVNEHGEKLLSFLNERLGLTPWTDSERFHQLEKQYFSLLVEPKRLYETP